MALSGQGEARAMGSSRILAQVLVEAILPDGPFVLVIADRSVPFP